MNYIIKRYFLDEVAQPHGPFFHTLPVFPRAALLKLSSPSIIQPQTRQFSTFIFLSKSLNMRRCFASPLQQFLWWKKPWKSKFCQISASWSWQSILTARYSGFHTRVIIRFPGTIKPAFLTGLLGRFSVLLPSFVRASHHSVCAAFHVGCIHQHTSPLSWMQGRGNRFKKTCPGTKLQFWGLRAVTPTPGSTSRIWGSAAEILMIKTVLVNWKPGFSLRSQTEETVARYFFVSRNPLQAFLSPGLLLFLLLISCIRHCNPLWNELVI